MDSFKSPREYSIKDKRRVNIISHLRWHQEAKVFIFRLGYTGYVVVNRDEDIIETEDLMKVQDEQGPSGVHEYTKDFKSVPISKFLGKYKHQQGLSDDDEESEKTDETLLEELQNKTLHINPKHRLSYNPKIAATWVPNPFQVKPEDFFAIIPDFTPSADKTGLVAATEFFSTFRTVLHKAMHAGVFDPLLRKSIVREEARKLTRPVDFRDTERVNESPFYTEAYMQAMMNFKLFIEQTKKGQQIRPRTYLPDNLDEFLKTQGKLLKANNNQGFYVIEENEISGPFDTEAQMLAFIEQKSDTDQIPMQSDYQEEPIQMAASTLNKLLKTSKKLRTKRASDPVQDILRDMGYYDVEQSRSSDLTTEDSLDEFLEESDQIFQDVEEGTIEELPLDWYHKAHTIYKAVRAKIDLNKVAQAKLPKMIKSFGSLADRLDIAHLYQQASQMDDMIVLAQANYTNFITMLQDFARPTSIEKIESFYANDQNDEYRQRNSAVDEAVAKNPAISEFSDDLMKKLLGTDHEKAMKNVLSNEFLDPKVALRYISKHPDDIEAATMLAANTRSAEVQQELLFSFPRSQEVGLALIENKNLSDKAKRQLDYHLITKVRDAAREKF